MNANVDHGPRNGTSLMNRCYNSTTVATSLANTPMNAPARFCATEDVTSKPGVSLPRLRELDSFPPGTPSTSMTYSPHPIGPPKGFPGSASPFSTADKSVPLAASSHQNLLPLSTATQYQHGPQDLALATRGCPPTHPPSLGLQSAAATPRRRRRSSSQFHCNVPEGAEQGHGRRATGFQGGCHREDRHFSNQRHHRLVMVDGHDGTLEHKRHRPGQAIRKAAAARLLATHPERGIKYA
ncbi:hypothetical protein LZ30DRAFT_694978 [Colletotrichum cereale]|nr:hypothetical protein LZ30DRAFT_694978 [Colletotrichum cereale]